MNNTSRLWRALGAAALAAALVPAAPAGEPGLGEVEQQFRTLPAQARRLTGPLFWLHGDETRQQLEGELAKVAEGGNGSFTAESRPHKDWLGEGWFRDLEICLEAARKHDLRMWIFDEKWWPSGEVGGQVPARYGSKRLQATQVTLAGPTRYHALLNLSNSVAVLAGRQTGAGLDGSSLVDLAPFIREGRLEWEMPEGNWTVMQFSWRSRLSGNRYLLDGASQDAVDWYIKTVYQPHYDRFKPEFGRHIAGYFYDEPETHGDWGTEVLKVLAERKADWKKALAAWKFTLAGEEQTAARYQYQDALAEAWGRTLYGGLSRWCKERDVVSMGHFLEHGNASVSPDVCAGNMFQLQKYSDMGAIDAVFTQFVWGKRVAQDAPCWQTPKLGSSISHVYGKADDVAMVEIFGARGQDLSYPEMKWWTDHMHVSGVSFMIPHSFNPRGPRDTDCPPYFYNGGFEPRWPLYRVYADYTSRLAVMLSGGRHVCPVALVHPGQSVHAGKARLPDDLSEALQDALYDCDWMPWEVLENDLQIAGRQLQLRAERYSVLMLPPVEVVPYASLVKIRDYFQAGGIVVGCGILPSRSATLGRSSNDVARLRETVWGAPAAPGLAVCQTNAAGGRAYFLPEKPGRDDLARILALDAGVAPVVEVLEGATEGWLHVLHRVKAGRDVFLVCNQNHLGAARAFRLKFTAPGEPECWDPMRNEITRPAFTRSGPSVELALTLEPSESVLIVFNDRTRPLPARIQPGAPAPAQVLALTRVPSPPSPAPVLEGAADRAQALEGGSWVWFPEGNPAQGAPPGARFFRRQFQIPEGRVIRKAVFTGTADNSYTLHVNGRAVNEPSTDTEAWRAPSECDLTAILRPGTNQLAIRAFNATDRPSPAGLLGVLRVQFAAGEPLLLRVDRSWKASQQGPEGWTAAGFDDSAWPAALEVAALGHGPWGRLGSALTLSPVTADPFDGHALVPAARLPGRVCLELEGLQPEEAARVSINGQFAGGVIGKPLRLDVTAWVKPGSNTFRIEPFAPASARLVFYTP